MPTESYPSDDLIERRRVSAERRLRASARRVAALGFAGAILAFALPFGAVEGCDGQEARFTGVELATFHVEEDRTYAFERTLHEELERHGGVLALATIVAAAVGLVLTTVVARRGARAAAIVGLVTIQALAWAIGLSADSEGTHFLVGFWVALGALLVALEALSVPARRARGERGVTLAGNLLLHALTAVAPVIAFAWL